MSEAIIGDARQRMDGAVQSLEKEFASVRTNRASPGILEGIRVDYHGTEMPLNQLAQITVGDARSLVIQPWDKTAMGMIEKAIQKSDLGIMPRVEKDQLRITMPPLTEQRRKDIVKTVSKRSEDARISIRSVRRDAIDKLRASEKAGELSEDQAKKSQAQVQKLTDDAIARVDSSLRSKEAELLQV